MKCQGGVHMPESFPGQDQSTDAAIKERLRDLLQTRWGGKLSRMASELHLAQPALWKIVNGDQPVNAKVLVAIAAYTTFNLHWLTTGQGPRSLEGDAALLNGT